jgi:hypothetical protein
MTEDEDTTIRQLLKGHGVFEAHRLIGEYRCYRRRADGENQEIRVRVLDMGSDDNPNARYSFDVEFETEDGEWESVSANPASSIHAAGMNVHWRVLDRKPASPQ